MSPSSSPNIKDGKKVSDEIRASNQFRTLKSMLFDRSHCPYLFLLTIVLLLLDPNKNPFTFVAFVVLSGSLKTPLALCMVYFFFASSKQFYLGKIIKLNNKL